MSLLFQSVIYWDPSYCTLDILHCPVDPSSVLQLLCLQTFPSRGLCRLLASLQRLFPLSVTVNQHFEFRVVKPSVFVEVTSLHMKNKNLFNISFLTSNIMSTFLWLILLFAVIHLNSECSQSWFLKETENRPDLTHLSYWRTRHHPCRRF